MISRDFAQLKHEADTRLMLRYVANNNYIYQPLLASYLGFASTAGITKKLKSWIKNDLITPFDFKQVFGNRSAKLYKLTTNGRAHASYYDGEYFFINPRAEVNVTNANVVHSVLMQKTYKTLEYSGFHCFEMEKSIKSAVKKFGHYPDIVAINSRKQKVAVEVECSLKDKRRYQSILYGYKRAIEANIIDSVAYVTPDLKTSRVLSTIVEKAINEKYRRDSVVIDLSRDDTLNRVIFRHIDGIKASIKHVEFIGLKVNGVEYGIIAHKRPDYVLVELLGSTNESIVENEFRGEISRIFKLDNDFDIVCCFSD